MFLFLKRDKSLEIWWSAGNEFKPICLPCRSKIKKNTVSKVVAVIYHENEKKNLATKFKVLSLFKKVTFLSCSTTAI